MGNEKGAKTMNKVIIETLKW